MSILSKGMEMPTSCEKCPFEREILSRYVCSISGKARSWGLKTRLSDCPLFYVPPHGDLIEKHDVFNLISSFPEIDKLLTVEFMTALYNLPTIIPTEENNHNDRNG